jgi:hypothetical protein
LPQPAPSLKLRNGPLIPALSRFFEFLPLIDLLVRKRAINVKAAAGFP